MLSRLMRRSGLFLLLSCVGLTLGFSECHYHEAHNPHGVKCDNYRKRIEVYVYDADTGDPLRGKTVYLRKYRTRHASHYSHSNCADSYTIESDRTDEYGRAVIHFNKDECSCYDVYVCPSGYNCTEAWVSGSGDIDLPVYYDGH